MIADILKTNGVYSDRDIQLFESKISIRNISKNEILLTPGEICTSVFYIITGAFYQFNYKNETEIIIDLHIDKEWLLIHNSFITQQPSDVFLKAYVDSTILELNIYALHWLIKESPSFLQLARIFEQPATRIFLFDNHLSPAQKYLYILENRNQLIQQFPLKFIASYLKITPETLSRVRENLAKQKTIS